MRFTELMGKEIINLHDGTRLGNIAEADLMLDMNAGTITAIILPYRSNKFSIFGGRQELVIPWSAVHKIGNEVVIINLDPTYSRRSKD
ncbi:MAG: YlmC/YmxH family sporulation protein [Clostridia bacterium]|nr:YlmC/YmxH family sporulation protein [Clostridia bacterium]